MQKLGITRLTMAVLCALPAAAAAQQGIQLKSQPTLILIPPTLREEVPLFIEADRLQGHQDAETEAEGDARLRKRGNAVHADWLRHDKPTSEVSAEGNVRIEQGADVVEGSRLRYNLETDRGFMENSRYTLHKQAEPGGARQLFREADARGTAERVLFEGPGVYRAERAEYTSCAPGNDDWYLRARDLRIEKERDIGVARDASIYFLGTPIFYSPYVSFSLHQERKTGFITPHYGSTNTGGAEITVPYYWNIAPNRDYTFSPRVMTRRGVLMDNEFRYLEPSYRGEAHAEIMPDDRVRNGDQRWAYKFLHSQTLPSNWFGALNLQRVSDDNYFTDLSTQIASTSQVQLPSQGTLTHVGTWGSAGSYGLNALAQRWQTLQVDPLAPVTSPYSRLPQLTLNAARQEILHADFDFYGHYVVFDHPTKVNAVRSLAYPSFSVPLQSSFAYVTPKFGVNVTRYAIDPNTDGFTDQNRTLPIFSADSGMVFERRTALGGADYLQTLEPRLYYLNIPFRDQSRIPVFDSGTQDINFATIYAENQFAGWDRISDANQLTLGVSSRLIAPETGIERLRVGVAQRYYFETQQVTLPDTPVRESTSSDLLAALAGAVTPHWTVETGLQYNTDFSQVQKFNVGARYQPLRGRVLNMSYRETRDVLRQTDVSTQWPVGGGWTGLARWNYSLLDKRTIEGLIGAEYIADCWSLRIVAHRFATTTLQASTTFFVQLELNGLSRIGSNPLDTLRRNIGGYGRLDPGTQRADESTPYLY